MTFVSHTDCHSSSVTSSNFTMRAMPTLFTTTSRPPRASTAAATAVEGTVGLREIGGDLDHAVDIHLGMARDDRHARPVGREQPRGLQADPAASAGDQNAQAVELEIHRGPS